MLVTFALDELAVSQATEHQKRTYQAIKLVRNRITHFGQIGYHYKLQDSAKMCAQY